MSLLYKCALIEF